jgi:hypothetical protein
VENGMPPQFFQAGQPVEHPLERLFNASGWDILSAIEKGFRAQVDVKGKLAELFLYLELEKLRSSGAITALEWRDKDGVPDFLLTYHSRDFQVECKNVRSSTRPKPGVAARPRKPTSAPPAWRVEIQKTRNQLTGGPGRGYKVDEFDILAVCLFNQNGRWEYLFIPTANLVRRPMHPDYLQTMQPVPPVAQGNWKATIEEVLRGMAGP